MSRLLTIGFISTWPIYQGMTIDRYAHALIRGIGAAARDEGCRLLLGCGFSIHGNPPQRRSFWPAPGINVSFVPVGPWNTDGLIIVPDELNEAQQRYVDDLLAIGFPLVFTTPEGPGTVVKVDNTSGIRQAFTHLLDHGHRRIAFIAGNANRRGDSGERLRAYLEALHDAGLPCDERLIAFGEHRREGGKAAMRQILASGASFTALIASNDLSCLGAIEVLQAHGYRIPEEIAVIGFDDILDARALSPSLTTVRHPTFSLGYQAAITLLEAIRGLRKEPVQRVVPTQLILRESCGCHPPVPTSYSSSASLAQLIDESVKIAFIEARNSSPEELKASVQLLIERLLESIQHRDLAPLRKGIKHCLHWSQERGEEVHLWQTVIGALQLRTDAILSLTLEDDAAFVARLLDQMQLEISSEIQRQVTCSLLRHREMTAYLGSLTAEMLSVINLEQIAEILSCHLPEIGIKSALVVLYAGDEEERTSTGVVVLGAGFPECYNGLHFDPRRFPVAPIYPSDHPVQLIILPLEVDEHNNGFIAFEAPNLELCAAIAHNLAAAVRTSRLYHEAIEGRRLAEEANRLKSRFLSMVSHELRTPLSLIVGLSEMVLRSRNVEKRDIEQIHANAQHLARLIGDVLDMASSEAGQLRIVREPQDLADVLRVAAKIGEQLATSKGLRWQANLPTQGPWVLGDRTRLRQLTLNLIGNAVKFTTEGEVRIDVTVQGGQAVVSVSDTGPGIPPEEIETIFTEFYRSSYAVESGTSGIGLGLTITRELIEQHGGNIQVRSPGLLGRGSTFTFTLPILSTEALPPESVFPLVKPDTVVLVLALQGDEIEPLTSYLKLRGFHVVLCRVDERPDWLEQINAPTPAAVILSDRLASRSGWEITGRLKHQPQTAHLPILAFSLDAENNCGELLELNFLHKPLQAEQLNQELARLLPSFTAARTVLVVDDDPDVLSMHSRLVEQAGYRALTARNGREALRVLEQTHPDLILLDLLMPEMDGFAVLDLLHAREKTRNIPVIILTAHTLSEDELERCNRSVASILSKGLFSAEETLQHIEAALEQRSKLGLATRQLIRRAVAYIHTHYAEPITRDEIAAAIGISPDYLSDCFRQEMGITPSTYLRRYRIRQACELLRNTTLSITQIAQNVGFADSSHFTHTFQREMGMTPKAYRRKH